MWFERPMRGESLPEATLSLTFDDGPGCPHAGRSESRTVELAHYLAEERIQATFFVVGQHLSAHPGFLEQLRGWGHAAGNHSFTHLRLNTSFATDAEITREIRCTSELLTGGASGFPIFFRPPFGAWTPRLAHVMSHDPFLRLNHVGPVNWDICGRDYAHWQRRQSPETCAEAYRKAIGRTPKKNGIVLFHDRSADDKAISLRNRTPELIRLLVPRLRSEGFSFTALQDVPAIRKTLEVGQSFTKRNSN